MTDPETQHTETLAMLDTRIAAWRQSGEHGQEVADQYAHAAACVARCAEMDAKVEKLKQDLNEARVRYAAACDEASALSNELDAWREREATVCPEDFGFEEVIKTLRADIAQRRKTCDDLSEANWDCRNRLAMAEAEIERLRPYEAKYKATTFGGDTTIVVMPRPTPPTETRDD